MPQTIAKQRKNVVAAASQSTDRQFPLQLKYSLDARWEEEDEEESYKESRERGEKKKIRIEGKPAPLSEKAALRFSIFS